MSVTETSNFFKQKRTAAEIKSEIIKTFFPAWCAHLLNQTDQPPATLLYVDLLAGPAYNPENIPTGPVLILNQIYLSRGADTDLNAAVKTFFYDAAKAVSEALTTDLAQLPYCDELAHPPVMLTEPAQREQLINLLNQQLPALLVADPFGNAYVQEILLQTIPSRQADLLLVFNPGKMRATIVQNQADNGPLALFGNWMAHLQASLQKESSARRKEQLTLETLESILRENKYEPFTFKINLPDKDQTSHYLLYAARAKPSYFLMKEIIALYSDYQEDGVPLFSVNQKPQLPLLPGFFQYLSKYTLHHLIEELSRNRRFHYRSIQESYEEHSVGTHFIKANYLQAFAELRRQGRLNLVDEQNKQVKKLTENAIVFYKLHGSKS